MLDVTWVGALFGAIVFSFSCVRCCLEAGLRMTSLIVLIFAFLFVCLHVFMFVVCYGMCCCTFTLLVLAGWYVCLGCYGCYVWLCNFALCVVGVNVCLVLGFAFVILFLSLCFGVSYWFALFLGLFTGVLLS